ncbi:hypothetical protein GGX14DRAFT_399420 [Mycena pura]|uniref:Uncharacterized protein n=1 Tax=Mycena pura TaxID=153505 RepID=A0AAD6Y6Y7_9AGAR|nr:hypothetical protein GGX14DRAFT_399420 [Mycena pura]
MPQGSYYRCTECKEKNETQIFLFSGRRRINSGLRLSSLRPLRKKEYWVPRIQLRRIQSLHEAGDPRNSKKLNSWSQRCYLKLQVGVTPVSGAAARGSRFASITCRHASTRALHPALHSTSLCAAASPDHFAHPLVCEECTFESLAYPCERIFGRGCGACRGAGAAGCLRRAGCGKDESAVSLRRLVAMGLGMSERSPFGARRAATGAMSDVGDDNGTGLAKDVTNVLPIDVQQYEHARHLRTGCVPLAGKSGTQHARTAQIRVHGERPACSLRLRRTQDERSSAKRQLAPCRPSAATPEDAARNGASRLEGGGGKGR